MKKPELAKIIIVMKKTFYFYYNYNVIPMISL